MRLEFYGASDDLIEIRRNGVDWEEICHDDAIVQILDSAGRGVELQARYAKGTGATWSIAPTFLDEGMDWPDGWELSIEPEHAYSPRIVLLTADRAVTVRWCPADEGSKPQWRDV